MLLVAVIGHLVFLCLLITEQSIIFMCCGLLIKGFTEVFTLSLNAVICDLSPASAYSVHLSYSSAAKGLGVLLGPLLGIIMYEIDKDNHMMLIYLGKDTVNHTYKHSFIHSFLHIYI
jgi:hypothetical protein